MINFRSEQANNLSCICQSRPKNYMMNLIETVGESSVSSGCWGEDSNRELAGAAHFHVALPAYKKVSSREFCQKIYGFCFSMSEQPA